MHFFFGGKPQRESIIQKTADALVPAGKSWEWHQALMDYGALALPRKTKAKKRGEGIPFRETNRFLRGRIMDLVRERSWKEPELLKVLQELYGRQRNDSLLRIRDMVGEGLLVRSRSRVISLP